MKYIVLAAFVALSLAGCSDSTPDDECGTVDDQGRHVVCMTSDFQFTPKEMTVPVGATVVWVQKSASPHDTEADDGSWKSPFLRAEGEEFTHTFTEAGSFSYRCNPHVAQYNMKGTITVTA